MLIFLLIWGLAGFVAGFIALAGGTALSFGVILLWINAAVLLIFFYMIEEVKPREPQRKYAAKPSPGFPPA